jgi:hypothetical protein
MVAKLGLLVNKIHDTLPLFIKKIYVKRKSRDELFEYWSSPNDGKNMPDLYLTGKERSAFLLNLVNKYTAKENIILEVGCNVGRNLNELFSADFKN